MSAVPAKQQLWHPTRGIAFSPGGSRTPASPVQDTHVPRTTSPAAPRAQHVPTAVRGRGAAAYVTQPRVSPDASAGGPTQISNTVKEAIVSAAAMTAAAAVEDQCHAGGKKPPEAPPVSVYDFKMVPELYDAARNAPAGSPESFWSYKQYRGPGEDGKARDVLVHYCTNLQAMERVCREHFSHEPVLGFDLEWIAGFTKSPNIRRNVSLIQLASPGHVALFHIAVFNARDGLVAPSFKAIMEDANIIKAGVNIRGDSTRLRNNLDIHCRGLMELSHLYKLVTYSPEHRSEKINKRLVPLAQQVEEYLHLPLFKGQDVRAGNWMRLLNMNQVKYSASDAYAGLQLYGTLEHHRKQLDPCPPRPYFLELDLPIRTAADVELSVEDEPPSEDLDEATTYASAPAGPPGEVRSHQDEEAESPKLVTPDEPLASMPDRLSLEDPATPLVSPAQAAPSQAPPSTAETPARDTTPAAAAAAAAATAWPPRPKLVARPLRTFPPGEGGIRHDSRVQAANDRAKVYLLAAESQQRRQHHRQDQAPTPTPMSVSYLKLQAFFLWHCYDLSPHEVSRLARAPPLRTAYTVHYILAVVEAEHPPRGRLPALDRDRLYHEVAALLPADELRARYPTVARLVGDRL